MKKEGDDRSSLSPEERAGDNRKRDDAVASPCIDVCRLNERTGLCEGCLRTIDEIAAWGSLDAAAKRAVLARIGARRERKEAAR